MRTVATVLLLTDLAFSLISLGFCFITPESDFALYSAGFAVMALFWLQFLKKESQ